MKNSLLWRALLILAVVGGAAMSAWPPENIALGLDLSGGMYLVLRVETDDALKAERDKAADRILQEAADEEIAGLEVAAVEAESVTRFDIRGVTSENEEAIREIGDDNLSGWSATRVGERLRYQLSGAEENRLREGAIRQALETIRRRVDSFGVAEPVIQRQSGERIVVQLPGVDDPERVKELLKSTAFLEFRLVDYPNGGQSGSTREDILAHYGGELPSQLEILDQDLWDEVSGERLGTRSYAVEKRPAVTGRDLKGARPSLGQFSEPIVAFQLTYEAGKHFAEVTGANRGRGLAIVLDGKVESAPRINGRIADSGIIEGRYTQQEVEDLANLLQSGALPASLTYLEERTVGPSLGRDSIQQGIRASLLGGILVVIAMLVVYHLTGLNAIVALCLNIVLVFGALASFGATLTLPGIAGIILTIGMAVDANVLVFERIREELSSGRTVKASVENGFGKALSSILDANITTLLAAMFLYNFGTGPIRGFAVTLSVGILASLFTAVFVSRWIFDLFLSRPGRVEKMSI